VKAAVGNVLLYVSLVTSQLVTKRHETRGEVLICQPIICLILQSAFAAFRESDPVATAHRRH